MTGPWRDITLFPVAGVPSVLEWLVSWTDRSYPPAGCYTASLVLHSPTLHPHKQLGWGVLSCCFPQLSSSKVRKSSRMYACYHAVNQEKGIFVRAVAATFTPPDSVFRYISKCWDGFNRKYPPDTPVQFLEQSWLHQLNNSAIFLVGRPPPA